MSLLPPEPCQQSQLDTLSNKITIRKQRYALTGVVNGLFHRAQVLSSLNVMIQVVLNSVFDNTSTKKIPNKIISPK